MDRIAATASLLWERLNPVIGNWMRPLRSRRQQRRTASVQDELVEIQPQIVILGQPGELPQSGADTAHLTVLNDPAPSDGEVESVRIRLGGRPPGDGARWEVRVYERDGGSRFTLVAKRSVRLASHMHRGEQTIALGSNHSANGGTVGLPICKGQFVGLANRDGRLNLTYTESDLDRFQPNPRDERVPYLWYQERVSPPHALGSRTEALRTWFGRASRICGVLLYIVRCLFFSFA